MSHNAKFVITFDTDWAPDWVMHEVASILISNEVKSTWFVTHDTPFLSVIRDHPNLFEIGIHPNCLPGSTQGASQDEILTNLKEIVPEAISMRTHGLYQSSNFLIKAATMYGIKIDASLFLPRMDYITPHLFSWLNAKLYRVPFFWSDDVECFQTDPLFRLPQSKFAGAGIKIFNFHPIHILLNTARFETYEKLRSLNLTTAQCSKDVIVKYSWNGDGPKRLFMDLVEYLRPGGFFLYEIIEDHFKTKLLPN